MFKEMTIGEYAEHRSPIAGVTIDMYDLAFMEYLDFVSMECDRLYYGGELCEDMTEIEYRNHACDVMNDMYLCRGLLWDKGVLDLITMVAKQRIHI